MSETLYDKIFDLDNLSTKSDSEFESRRAELYDEYKNNPIFLDATNGKKTVAKSLEEISEPNQGLGSFFPRIRNKKHNSKVNYIHQLLEKRGNLKSNGLLYPDNTFNGAAYAGIGAYYISTAIINFLIEGKVNEYNAEFSEHIKAIMPWTFTLMAVLGGGMICGWNRHENMNECNFQAECIDKRIEKYYLNYNSRYKI